MGSKRKRPVNGMNGSANGRIKECPITDFPNYGGDGHIYRFPGLGLSITGADSFEEAKALAKEAARQMSEEFEPIDEDEKFQSEGDIIPIEKWFTI